MSEPKGGKCTILFRKGGEAVDDDGEFCKNHGEGLADEYKVGVASYGSYRGLRERWGVFRVNIVSSAV